MTTPEIPRTTYPESTIPKPSNTLLTQFKKQIEQRWKEFDVATMKEANSQTIAGVGARAGRDADENFIKAKQAFDQARIALDSVTDDAGLKQILNSPGNLLSAINTLEAHFAKATAPEKAKEYNHVLANTLADLKNLKSQVTNTQEDKNAAEVAAKAAATMPTIVAGAAIGAVASNPSVSIEQVAARAQAQAQESASGLRGWISEKTKEKGMIGDIFRDLEKKATAWVKDLATPPSEGWIDSPWENMKHMLKKWFAPILAGIFGISMDIPKPPETTPKHIPEVKPGETTETIVDDIAFKAGYKGFVRMYYSSVEGISPDISPIDIDSAFQYTAFLSMKHSEAEGLYRKYKSNHKGLLSEAQFTGITNAEGAFAALSLIVSGRSGEFLRKRYPNAIKDMTIKDLITGIKDSFDIAEGIEGIEIRGMEDITGFMGKLGEKMDISFDNGKISQDGIKVKADKMGLTDTKLLAFTLFEGRARPISDFSNDASIDGLSDISPEGKKKLREIMAFGKVIMATLTKNCSLGEEAKYVEKFKTVNPTLGDITKMYIMLSGKTDFSTMSQAEHIYCYQKTWHFLGVDQDFRGKYFDKPMYMAIADKTSTAITPEMRETMQRIMHKSVETMMKKMRGVAGELYNAMEWYHVAAIGAALGVYFMYGKKLAWIGTGIALAVIAQILADVLSKFPKGSDGKHTLPSGAKITPQEGAEALTIEAERIGM